jgi:hypothetical protein
MFPACVGCKDFAYRPHPIGLGRRSCCAARSGGRNKDRLFLTLPRASTRKIQIETGHGVLRYGGFSGEVDYQITGSTEAIRRDAKPLRGSIIMTPELALTAFRAGKGHLTLQSGATYPVTFLAHTAGDATIYFEISFEVSSMSRPVRPSQS